MRFLHFAGLVVGVTVLGFRPAVAGTDALPWEQMLPFESGVIHYSLEGIDKGKETVYFRNWGRERAAYHESVAAMMGVSSRKSEVEIKTADYICTYDLQKNEGVKEINPQKILRQEYEKLSAAEQKNVRKTARQMTTRKPENGPGGEIIENAITLLGYRCDRITMMGGPTSYLIHNTDIVLKTEMDMGGMKMSSVATSLKTGPVDGKYFVPPMGIVPEVDAEAEEMARQMAAETITMLKDPNAAGRRYPPPMMGPPPPPPPGMGSGDMADGSGEMMPMMVDPLPPR